MAKQIALIARWHARATELGTRLLAISCFDSNRFISGTNALEDDFMSFQALDLDFTAEVIDLLHDYCFTLRKLIERTDKVAHAKELKPHSGMSSIVVGKGGMDEHQVELSQKSLWWIMGRVVHSKSVLVLGGDFSNLIVYPDGKTREYPDGRCYVQVSSDFDKEGEEHVFHVPSLVRVFTFSAMGHGIQDEVRRNAL